MVYLLSESEPNALAGWLNVSASNALRFACARRAANYQGVKVNNSISTSLPYKYGINRRQMYAKCMVEK